MGGNLLANYGEAVAMLLFGIGFANLLFQKNLIFSIFNSLYYLHNFTLQIYEAVNILVDFLLQVDNLAYGICHSGTSTIGVSRHTRQCGGTFCGEVIKGCDLGDFCVYTLIQAVGL